MTPCEQEIIGILTVALTRNLEVEVKILARLAREAGCSDQKRVRFWTQERITMAFLAIGDLRKGHRYQLLIDNWFLPALRHLVAWKSDYRGPCHETCPVRAFVAFARQHGISVDL